MGPGGVHSSIGDQRLDGVRHQRKDPLKSWLITGVVLDKGRHGMRPTVAATGVQELPELVDQPSWEECAENHQIKRQIASLIATDPSNRQPTRQEHRGRSLLSLVRERYEPPQQSSPAALQPLLQTPSWDMKRSRRETIF